jgi:hypothetical protein
MAEHEQAAEAHDEDGNASPSAPTIVDDLNGYYQEARRLQLAAVQNQTAAKRHDVDEILQKIKSLRKQFKRQLEDAEDEIRSHAVAHLERFEADMQAFDVPSPKRPYALSFQAKPPGTSPGLRAAAGGGSPTPSPRATAAAGSSTPLHNREDQQPKRSGVHMQKKLRRIDSTPTETLVQKTP